jgi:hypothetical protein
MQKNLLVKAVWLLIGLIVLTSVFSIFVAVIRAVSIVVVLVLIAFWVGRVTSKR